MQRNQRSKAIEFQKNIYFCFIDYTKVLDCVDHNKLWEILQEMGIPDHLTCFLRNLHAGQEATVRAGHGTTDWFHIGKGVHQGCILSPCLFNLYAEDIMWNDGLDEAQSGIKIAGENINNLIYADDTTLVAESKEKLKSLLIKVKEESEKAGLKLNIHSRMSGSRWVTTPSWLSGSRIFCGFLPPLLNLFFCFSWMGVMRWYLADAFSSFYFSALKVMIT